MKLNISVDGVGEGVGDSVGIGVGVGTSGVGVGKGSVVGVGTGVSVGIGVGEGVGIAPDPTNLGSQSVSIVKPSRLAIYSKGTSLKFWFRLISTSLFLPSWAINIPLGKLGPRGKLVTSIPSVPVTLSIIPS